MFKKKVILFFIALIFIVSTAVATGKIIYVDDDAPVSSVEDSNGGKNDGSSWENAYIFLQDALADANDSDKPVEIRVAQGTYKPNQGQILNNPPIKHLEFANFSLINNVTIKGGYAGVNESDPNVRNIELYKSILSGDLNGDDVEVNNPRDLLYEPSHRDNSLTVLYSNENDTSAVLDGFTIKGGSNWGSPSLGGGMHIYKGNPTIINCIFTGNSAYEYGGGICIDHHSPIIRNPIIINCTFTKNHAKWGGGIFNVSFRGGLASPGNPTFKSVSTGNPTIENCVFSNNYSTSDGAGMCNRGRKIVMSNCTFTGNFSESSGGGLYTSGTVELDNCIFTNNSTMNEGGAINSNKGNSEFIDCIFENNHAYIGGSCAINSVEISFINCAFVGNQALSEGGAISNSSQAYGISNVHLENCLFAGNSSGWIGGAINFREKINGRIRNCTISHNRALYGESLCFKPFHAPTKNFKITSSILWGGDKQIYNGNNSKITVTCSDIQGGWEGQGNIDKDPLFADPNNGDFHLKSQAGRFDPNSGNWVIDDVTSPCIDTGDPNSSIGDEPIPNGCRINMGAYGGTQQASMSLSDANGISVIGQASDPIPANEAIDVDLDIILSWMSDPNAIMYEVYFGTDNPPPFIRRQLEKEFYPGNLDLNTRYYWRIDELDGLCNKITGDIWEFTTAPIHSQATNPNPADKALDVDINTWLSWSPGFNAIVHDVYLGTDFDDVNNATTTNTLDVLVSRGQSSNSYNPGSLEFEQTYYWRVDEIDSEGEIVTGDIWMFKTFFVPSKGRACFVSDTPVWVDGKFVPISKVAASQIVSGISGKIETVQEHEGTFTCYDISLGSGKTITVAENHYFMSESGKWLSLHNLKSGTRLKTSKGSVGIKSITKRLKPYTGRVYNLKIKDSEQYLVGQDAIIVRDY